MEINNFPKTTGYRGFFFALLNLGDAYFAEAGIDDALAIENIIEAQAALEGISLGEYYKAARSGNSNPSYKVTKFREVRKPVSFWFALLERAGIILPPIN